MDSRLEKRNTSPEAVLKTVLDALKRMRQENLSLDELLDSLNGDPVLRRRAASLLFTVFRRKNQLEKAILMHCSKTPERQLLELLTAALAMAHYQDSLARESVVNIAVTLGKKLHGVPASRFINALLRKALNSIESVDALLLPALTVKRWRKTLGDDACKAMEELFASEAPTTVRLRSGFDLADAAAETLALAKVNTKPPELPWQFFTCSDTGKLLKSSEFAAGAFIFRILPLQPCAVC